MNLGDYPMAFDVKKIVDDEVCSFTIFLCIGC